MVVVVASVAGYAVIGGFIAGYLSRAFPHKFNGQGELVGVFWPVFTLVAILYGFGVIPFRIGQSAGNITLAIESRRLAKRESRIKALALRKIELDQAEAELNKSLDEVISQIDRCQPLNQIATTWRSGMD
jgi:hypothetical protein